MRIEALCVPYRQAGSDYYAVKGALKIKMRNVLKAADLDKFKSYRARSLKLGKAFYSFSLA